MEEKQIRKYLRRSFRPLGWSLTVYYGIMNIMVVAAMVTDAARLALVSVRSGSPVLQPEELMTAVTGNAWGYLATIAVAMLILIAWKGGDFFREEIFAREKRMSLKAFLGILCVFMGGQTAASLYASVLELLLNALGLSAMMALEAATVQAETFSMFLYASIAAPIAEEILFRGFVQRSLMPFGKKFAIFGAALLFGMFHGNLVQTPYAFAVGLVLGYVAAEYSIFWAIALHMVNNMLFADLLPRLLSWLPQLTQDILLSGIMWIFAIAGIVILIVKRRQVAAYLQSEWMDRRCLRAFFTNSGFIVLAVLMILNMLLMVTPL